MARVPGVTLQRRLALALTSTTLLDLDTEAVEARRFAGLPACCTRVHLGPSRGRCARHRWLDAQSERSTFVPDDSAVDRSAAGTGRGDGLVISAKTPRSTPPPFGFPSADLVGMIAACLRETAAQPVWDGLEGPRWFLTVSPGSIRVRSTDLARSSKTLERIERRRAADVELRVALELAGVEWTERESGRGLVTSWSRKSRANMTRRLCTLDYAPLVAGGTPAMVTLTYPGEWLSVAPDGRAVKKHLERFRSRWVRRFGTLTAVWKLEFQARGAPHFHLLMPIPAGVELAEFRAWVALAWSESIDHADPVERLNGLRAGTAVDVRKGATMTDPRRVGVYFSKHGIFAAKDYQNEPPAEWLTPEEGGSSVGRFWGYWGLRPVEVSASVSAGQAAEAARLLRGWQRQSGSYVRDVDVWRVQQSTGRMRKRRSKQRVLRMRGTAGFLAVNDGPSVGLLLDQGMRLSRRRERSPSTVPGDYLSRLAGVVG